MQHSFLIKTVLPSQPVQSSFLEICQCVCSLIGQLASIDSVFSEFNVPSAGSSSCSYELPPGSTSQEINVVAEQMANDLIEYARDDIARHDNEPNPTINFKRSIGLGRALIFSKVKKNRLEIRFGLGGGRPGSFNIKYFAKNKENINSLEWYENVLKCLIDHFNPTYCALIFATMEFHDEQKEMNLPQALGWMTYLKNDAGIVVPDTLQDAVIEQYGEGKFVLISRDEEYSESLSLADKRVKVLDYMKQLGRENS